MKPIKILVSALCTVLLLTLSVSAGTADFNIEETMKSVFTVSDDSVTASGFAIGENVIITNAHVVLDLKSYNIITSDYDFYDAYLIAYDKERDIAALCVEDLTVTPIPVRDHMEMNIGDDVYAVGSPKGFYFSTTKGVISAKERDFDGYTYIQSDAVIYGGNSGGPLFDSAGNVVGVNAQNVPNADGLTFSIPITDVVTFLNNIGLETDENGNVIGRVELKPEYSHTNPTLSGDDEEEPDDKPATKSIYQLTAWDAAVIATAVGLVSLVFNAVLLLALRRTNERLRLSNMQKRAAAKNDGGDEKTPADDTKN